MLLLLLFFPFQEDLKSPWGSVDQRLDEVSLSKETGREDIMEAWSVWSSTRDAVGTVSRVTTSNDWSFLPQTLPS